MLAETTRTEEDRVAEYNAHVIKRRNAAEVLGRFKIDGALVLPNGRDGADQILRQISGLCTVLENAHLDADTADRIETGTSHLHAAYPVFIARAFEAIGTLAALAVFFGEAE